ncbi:acetyl-CoA hydrolase/transferase C-terminal domain-containing protein [Lutibaculum baratangense]|uniref:Acetyl-CoA hydrolase/transferase C-terminal domain-containing protein n=1 Tax=Lutibaculum baratangense AMV1 TaxID=631454 RepID=V4REP8_9HYPH|nr:acetyl-CoA hydrolase/transferase C-terminal domain-containing protein [Lutibaculum baratangense]ESR23854.1 hypothetical protein N177_2799 [Lutibaculum baratangense AMV1]
MQTRRHDDAERVVDAIIDTVGKEIVLGLPLGLGKANTIANALYLRAVGDPSIRLTIFTALTLEKPWGRNEIEKRFLDPVIERMMGEYPDLLYARALHDRSLPPNVKVNEFFVQAGRWLGCPAMQQHYISANYTHAARYALEQGVNVFAQAVAKREAPDGRRYSVSCNADITLDLLAARRAGETGLILVGEVNDELPFMGGDAEIGEEVFTDVLDTGEGFSLFAPPKEPVSLTDHAIALHVARLVPDGGTLQIGIGSMGDAVAHALILRHRDNKVFRQAALALDARGKPGEVHEEPFAKGLYGCSEMLVDSFLDLVEAGVVSREVDGALVHSGFFVGPRSLYDRLKAMSQEERDRFRMRAISWINELYGEEEKKRQARAGARFCNNAMMATLMGAVVSDQLEDGRVVSGVGGQYNFVAQAFALRDARSIITLRSTRKDKGQTVSNIRWSYGHTTIPRHLRDILVTEYGVADLRGRTDADTIAAMLSVTDARFQDELLEKAKSAGKIGRDYRIPEAHRRNTPERIRKALEPHRDKLPLFPFGTDFTEVEQRLMPALGRMREASGSKRELMGLAWKGWRGKKPSAEEAEALERMGYAKPKSSSDRLYRAVLLGALRG